MRNEISGTVTGNVVQGRDVTVTLPAALPVAIAGLPAQPVFVGRCAVLAQLAGVFKPTRTDIEERPVVVSAVAGLAGVGKTALAMRAAHDAITAGSFPGGVLMMDLRGYALLLYPGPMTSRRHLERRQCGCSPSGRCAARAAKVLAVHRS